MGDIEIQINNMEILRDKIHKEYKTKIKSIEKKINILKTEEAEKNFLSKLPQKLKQYIHKIKYKSYEYEHDGSFREIVNVEKYKLVLKNKRKICLYIHESNSIWIVLNGKQYNELANCKFMISKDVFHNMFDKNIIIKSNKVLNRLLKIFEMFVSHKSEMLPQIVLEFKK
jgi:hypothetical protein